MIKNLIELLEVARGESENIRIAQGKYYLPETFKGTFNKIKKEIKWLKDTQ